MNPVLLVVLTYLGKHWKGIVIAVVAAGAGVWVGRHTLSLVCPPAPPPPVCPSLRCAEKVECPTLSLDAGVIIRWIPNPAPSVPGCPALPPLPEVVVGVTGVASGGTAEARSSAVEPPPSKVPDIPLRQPEPVAPLFGKQFDLGVGAGVNFSGNLNIPAEFVWYPLGWDVGLGLMGNVVPKDGKTSSVNAMVHVRWK